MIIVIIIIMKMIYIINNNNNDNNNNDNNSNNNNNNLFFIKSLDINTIYTDIHIFTILFPSTAIQLVIGIISLQQSATRPV